MWYVRGTGSDKDDDDDDDGEGNEIDFLRQQLTTKDEEIETLQGQLEAKKKELVAVLAERHQPETGK